MMSVHGSVEGKNANTKISTKSKMHVSRCILMWFVTQHVYVFCVQDGRDGAVAAAESGRPGAVCFGHNGHHEGL